jgi:glutathione peroxidase
MPATLFDFNAQLSNGTEVPLSQFRGQVVLVVNTASKCGFVGQFKGLETLHNTYRSKGFTVLGFPSDNFMQQEFGNNDQIQQFCQLNYGVSFPIFARTNVIGKEKHPLFAFLANKKENLHANASPMWNFQKYLFDRDGKLQAYFWPILTPNSGRIHSHIKRLL